MTQAIRTPDERFRGLPEFPFAPRYLDDLAGYDGLRMPDPVLGAPVMRALRRVIRGCPEPYEMIYAGHFVQEWGEEAAKKALIAFGLTRDRETGTYSES